MGRDCKITQNLLEAQKLVFERIEEAGVARKVITARTGIGETSLSGYASGRTGMPLAAFVVLVRKGQIPLEVLSLLLPDDIQLAKVPNEVPLEVVTMLAEEWQAQESDSQRVARIVTRARGEAA